MSAVIEHTVLLRDHDGVWSFNTVGSWIPTVILGSLSADPRCLSELERALLRYRAGTTLDELIDQPGAPAPPRGPWTMVDLASRRVLVGGGAELPENGEAYSQGDAEWEKGMPCAWMNFPPDWELVDGADWSDAMQPLAAPAEPLDARGVLFGRPLAQGLVRRVIDVARNEAIPAKLVFWDDPNQRRDVAEEDRPIARRWHELTKQVHADWLMTSREDLEGQTPRAFLHWDREWIEMEIENRTAQWTYEGAAPPPLDRDTFAYRHGPFGRHEVVMYFDLCRELLRTAWIKLTENLHLEVDAFAHQLLDHMQWWLAEGKIDDDPMPPGEIIENERRRMPLVSSGAHLDCDCPMCRMEQDGGMGPTFCGFDGHHLEMDGEFAFSLCETREEWEEEREYYECDEPLGSPPTESQSAAEADVDDDLKSAWKNSFASEVIFDADTPPYLSLFVMAARMAELVEDLKDANAASERIGSLNVAFDRYRAAEEDPVLSRAAAVTLVDVLEQIAAEEPRLTPKVADLQSHLDRRQRANRSNSSGSGS